MTSYDIVGDLIIAYINLIFFVLIFISIILAFFTGSIIIPIILILLVIGVNIIMKTLVAMVKTVYFTLFYMAIMMPMKIVPAYRKEVTGYLKYKETKGYKVMGKTVIKPMQTEEQKIKKLVPYVKQYRRQKYTDAQITKFLTQAGWPQGVVKKTLKRA